MIVGIGNDLLEINRVQKAIQRPRFVEKYFTEKEQLFFKERQYNPSTIGGNFSVKEAVSKALGTGFRKFELKDIEVLRDALGKPVVTLYNDAKAASDALNIHHWHVTISHTKDLVFAVAIGEQ